MARETEHKPKVASPPKALTAWIDVLVKIAALAAGLFAYYEYSAQRHDQRVERALEHIAHFQNPDRSVGASVALINQTLRAYQDRIRELRDEFKRDPSSAKVMRAKLIQELLDGTENTPGIASAADNIVRFYEAPMVCVTSGLCDLETARAHLAQYAYVFWSNFADQLILGQRDLQPDYGMGIEFFRDLHKESPQ